MPTTYVPKTNPLSKARLIKSAKDILKTCDDDRDKALSLFEHFKEIARDGEVETEIRLQANKLAVDCLKLAQTSKDKSVKLIDTLIKLDAQVNKPDSVEEELPSVGFESISQKANAK
jgi:hypothetical protein